MDFNAWTLITDIPDPAGVFSAIAAFSDPPHEVSAYALLEAMFQIAFRTMYKSRWRALPKPVEKSEAQHAVEDDRSVVTTILNDA